MKKHLSPFAEYLAESATACLVTMVQGNILAVTVTHLLVASQTGVIAGVLTAVTLAVASTRRRWAISLVLGVMTGVVDYFVHPGMFGTVAAEAVVTGVVAAVLSYVAGTIVRYVRRKKTKAT